MKDFFVTLTSVKNGVASHTFSESVYINKNASLALSEILFANSFPKVFLSNNSSIKLLQIDEYARGRRQRKYHFLKTYTIKEENNLYFTDVHQLISYLNEKTEFAGIEFTYLSNSRHVAIRFRTMRNKKFKLSLHESIDDILGNFMKIKKTIGVTTISAQQVDIHKGFHHVYIYCSSIKYSYIGDVKAPILRVVNIQKKHTYTHHIYKKPYYMKMNPGYLQHLEIDFRNQNGERINFHPKDHFQIVLHFINE